jgi:hypothetical protein
MDRIRQICAYEFVRARREPDVGSDHPYAIPVQEDPRKRGAIWQLEIREVQSRIGHGWSITATARSPQEAASQSRRRRAGDSKLRAASEASRSSRKPNPTGRRVDQSDDAERAACSRHGELIAAFRCTALLRFALRDTRSVTRRDAHARRKQQRQHQRHCDDSAASGKLSAALRNVAERALTWLETG